MKFFVGFFPLVFLLASCTTMYQLHTPKHGEGFTVREFNDAMHGESAIIELKRRGGTEGVEVMVASDSLYWLDESTLAPHSAPLSSVYRVSIHDHWRGLTDGLLSGAGLLGVISATVAYVVSTGLWRAVIVTIGLVAGIGGGIVLGSIIGAMAGHTIVYQFYPQSE